MLNGKGGQADGDALAVDIPERLDIVVFSETAIQGADDIAAGHFHGSIGARNDRAVRGTIPEAQTALVEATAHLQPAIRYQRAISSLADYDLLGHSFLQ